MNIPAFVRFGAAALSAILLAGCGSPSPSAAFAPVGADAAATRPRAPHSIYCGSPEVTTEWKFKGACSVTTMGTTGGTNTIPAYQGYTIETTLVARNGQTNEIAFMDALNKNDDIARWRGELFPGFRIKRGALIFERISNGRYYNQFVAQPGFVLRSDAAHPLPKGPCLVRFWVDPLSEWLPLTKEVMPEKHSLTIPPEKTAVPYGLNGNLYLAFVCK